MNSHVNSFTYMFFTVILIFLFDFRGVLRFYDSVLRRQLIPNLISGSWIKSAWVYLQWICVTLEKTLCVSACDPHLNPKMKKSPQLTSVCVCVYEQEDWCEQWRLLSNDVNSNLSSVHYNHHNKTQQPIQQGICSTSLGSTITHYRITLNLRPRLLLLLLLFKIIERK